MGLDEAGWCAPRALRLWERLVPGLAVILVPGMPVAGGCGGKVAASDATCELVCSGAYRCVPQLPGQCLTECRQLQAECVAAGASPAFQSFLGCIVEATCEDGGARFMDACGAINGHVDSVCAPSGSSADAMAGPDR
jgi:hypothetical protein